MGDLKVKNTIKGCILGFIIAAFVLNSVNVFASGIEETINLVINKINISINGNIVGNAGENYTLSNGQNVPYSILYKDTTYLPIRKIAELLGKDVTWDGETNTAKINDGGYIDKDELVDNGRTFQDVNIESAIREQLRKLTGDLTDADLQSIKSLRISNVKIESLRGIEKLVNLESLELTSTGIEDISYLKNLSKIKDLSLFGNNISDIEVVRGMDKLESLNIRYNSRISDLSPLEDLTNLKALYVTGTNVKDISPLVTNIKNGGFSTGIGTVAGKGSIMILENKLDLSNSVTLENLQYIIDKGINIRYLPQNK